MLLMLEEGLRAKVETGTTVLTADLDGVQPMIYINKKKLKKENCWLKGLNKPNFG